MIDTLTLEATLALLRDNPRDVNGDDSARALVDHGMVVLPDVGTLHSDGSLVRPPRMPDVTVLARDTVALTVKELSGETVNVTIWNNDRIVPIPEYDVRIELSHAVIRAINGALWQQRRKDDNE